MLHSNEDHTAPHRTCCPHQDANHCAGHAGPFLQRARWPPASEVATPITATNPWSKTPDYSFECWKSVPVFWWDQTVTNRLCSMLKHPNSDLILSSEETFRNSLWSHCHYCGAKQQVQLVKLESALPIHAWHEHKHWVAQSWMYLICQILISLHTLQCQQDLLQMVFKQRKPQYWL